MSRLSRYFKELIRLGPRSTGAPGDPEEGDLWMDASVNPSVLTYQDNGGAKTVASTDDTLTSTVVSPGDDNRLARWDGTTGQNLQQSGVTLDDSDNMSGITLLTATSVAATITTATQATIDHDSLANFVADEHVAHTGVTLTAGSGLSGGGDISVNRTFNVDINSATDKASPVAADELLIADSADSNNIKKADVASFLDALNGAVTETLLTSATLTDNQSSAADVFTLTASSNTGVVVEYSLTRGSGNSEVGHLFLVNDTSSADVSGNSASIGTLGVTFTADIDSGNVRLRYTTTSTGTAVTMQYSLRRWTA